MFLLPGGWRLPAQFRHQAFILFVQLRECESENTFKRKQKDAPAQGRPTCQEAQCLALCREVLDGLVARP